MSDKIICYCSNVDEDTIIKAIKQGARSLRDIRKLTNACTIGKCDELSPTKVCCSPKIIELINQYSKCNSVNDK